MKIGINVLLLSHGMNWALKTDFLLVMSHLQVYVFLREGAQLRMVGGSKSEWEAVSSFPIDWMFVSYSLHSWIKTNKVVRNQDKHWLVPDQDHDLGRSVWGPWPRPVGFETKTKSGCSDINTKILLDIWWFDCIKNCSLLKY